VIQLLLPVIGKVLDAVLPNTAEAAQAKTRLAEMAMQGELDALQADIDIAKAQILVNEKAAQSSDLFVSGARPFILWVCGGAFAWSYLLRDFVLLLAAVSGSPIDPEILPKPEMAEMMPVLLGLLGLGGFRSWEKARGVARSKL
jgi:hypothetical protein